MNSCLSDLFWWIPHNTRGSFSTDSQTWLHIVISKDVSDKMKSHSSHIKVDKKWFILESSRYEWLGTQIQVLPRWYLTEDIGKGYSSVVCFTGDKNSGYSRVMIDKDTDSGYSRVTLAFGCHLDMHMRREPQLRNCLNHSDLHRSFYWLLIDVTSPRLFWAKPSVGRLAWAVSYRLCRICITGRDPLWQE